jgi:hypothetical protein
MMQDVGKVLLEHLGLLPDAVLILRDGDSETCRTLFAANPLNYKASDDPRAVMTEILLSAVGQNKMVNEAIRQRKLANEAVLVPISRKKGGR